MGNLEIRAIMLGGRRTGKTSVLAGMHDCFEKDVENIIGINLTSPDDNTIKILEEQTDKINLYFKKNRETPELPFTLPDTKVSKLTEGTTNYFFDLSLKNKKCDKITLTFSDLKGEVMEKKKQFELELKSKSEDKKEIQKESDILIICIDTPHLLEADSLYSQRKNKIRAITDTVKSFISESKNKNKLVLFIPTKCEYCYNKNNDFDRGADDIFNKVEKVYSGLINNIKEDSEIIIVPVFTIGTLEFHDFDTDHGDIIEEDELPKFPRYIYKDRILQNESEPKYLDLIILFILSYVLTIAKKLKEEEKSDFWKNFFPNVCNFFKEKFCNFASVEDFMQKLEYIKKQVKHKDNIYKIVSDPMGIFGDYKKKEENYIDEIFNVGLDSIKLINKLNRFL